LKILLVLSLILISVIQSSCSKDEARWTKLLNGARKAVLSMLGMKVDNGKLDTSSGLDPGINTSDTRDKALTEPEVNVLLAEAKNMISDGKIEESIDYFLSILGTNPDHQECNSLVGALLLGLGQYSMAEGFLYSAVQISNWTDAAAAANLALSLKQAGDAELSSKTLWKCHGALYNSTTASNESYAIISEALGDSLCSSGNFSIAADIYLQAAIRRPYDINLWIKASTMQFPTEHRDVIFAENVLLQGLTYFSNSNNNNVDISYNNNSSAELLFQLAVLMHLTDRPENAIPLYEEVLRQLPTYSTAWSALATAVHSIGNFPRALELYKVAETTDTSNVIMLANYAILLCEHLSQEEDASMKIQGVQVLQKAQSIDATNADVVRAIAACK